MTLLTAQALLYYTLGLWAFSVIRVIDAAFFALQDRKSPLKAAVVALIVNVAFSLLLMFPLKHGGIALATSIASAVNVIMLAVILRRKVGTILHADFYAALARIAAAALAMWVSLVLVGMILPWRIDAPFDARLLFLVVSVAVGLAVFFSTSYVVRSPEMVTFVAAVNRRLRRR